MKRSILVFSMMLLLSGGLMSVKAQDQPKPKKDTVNIDTDAKPTFYYAEEEKSEKSGLPIIAIIGGVTVVVGAVSFYLLRKKKA